MSNTAVTSSIVARETLAILKNRLSFSASVNRDWEEEYTGNMSRGYAPGATINIRKPSRYTYRAGRVAVPQASIETTVPLTLSQGGADLNFTAFERTVSFTNRSVQNKLSAAVATVVNEIDRQGLSMARFAVFNTLNPTGVLPTTQALALAAVTDMNTRLDEMGAPRDDERTLIMNPKLNGAMVQGFAGLFNSQRTISRQFDRGMMVDSLGIAYGMDQNVDRHTNGAATATNINGANQTGATITVVAVAGGTLTRGTVITLPGVNAVNPQNRTDTGSLANFVVTADVLAGATSIPISPAIVTSGPYQNVTASPTTAAPYVIIGAASTSYNTNVASHRDAFTLAMVPMWKPTEGMGAKVSQMSSDGFTVKVTDFYDGVNDNAIMRIDVLFGWAATYPELGVKYYTV
jgi:hypothetical protein